MKFFFFSFMVILMLMMGFLGFDAQALTFSNPRILLTLSSGESKTETIHLTNELGVPQAMSVQVRDFVQGQEEGSPVFVDKTYTGITQFVSLSVNQFQMKESEQRDFRYQISVPANTMPGTYYGAIHFASTSLDGKNIVAVTGPLIFITVRGSAVSSLSVKSGPQFPEALDSHPTKMMLRLQNDGTEIVVPEGKIEVKNMAGVVVRHLDFNRKEEVILPSSQRELVAGIGDVEMPQGIRRELNELGIGRYQVFLSLDGSSDLKNVLVGEYWVFPWRVSLALTAFGILIATVLGVFFPHKHKEQDEESRKLVDNQNKG